MTNLTEQLTITPETIDTVPPIMVNNWDRKAELETSYDTVINKMEDGTEQRLSRKVRPHRFEFIRLTSMYPGDLQEMTTYGLRACDQVNITPVYCDATAVTDEGIGVLSGDFSHTRFFPGGRVVVLELDGCSRVVGQEVKTVSAAQDSFIILDSALTLTGSILTAIPLMDCDIELRSVIQDGMTGRVSSIDLNINEKVNESALVPLSTPVKAVSFFDDFETLGVDPLKWPIVVGNPTVANGQLILTGAGSYAQSVDGLGLAESDSVIPYTISNEGGPYVGFHFRTVFRFDGFVDNPRMIISHAWTGVALELQVSWIDVAIPDSSYPISGLSHELNVLKTGGVVLLLLDEVLLDVFSGVTGTLDYLSMEVPVGESVQAEVSSVFVYDSPNRQFSFVPETYEGFPVFTTPHNWADSLQVEFFRDGTRTDFGRGRIVVVDSERPQYQFGLKALMDREETFSFLRFFDWAKGRLAPFWFKNPQELWEVDSVSSGEVQIKAYRNTPDDILDFFKFVWIRATDGTEAILQISDVIVSGDNLAIQTVSTFDSLKTWTVCSSTHLVRFKSDALREVWSNRQVCQISFDLLELLEDPPVSADFIWGGLPNTETDEFVFGGFPDTVYALPGYWGGEPDI